VLLDGEDDIDFVLIKEMVDEDGFVVEATLSRDDSILLTNQVVNDKVL
jgi:hypothetical protein